jgi:hypothetical protein
MNSKLLKKIEAMLVDAAVQKTWGDIQIDLKDDPDPSDHPNQDP